MVRTNCTDLKAIYPSESECSLGTANISLRNVYQVLPTEKKLYELRTERTKKVNTLFESSNHCIQSDYKRPIIMPTNTFP